MKELNEEQEGLWRGYLATKGVEWLIDFSIRMINRIITMRDEQEHMLIEENETVYNAYLDASRMLRNNEKRCPSCKDIAKLVNIGQEGCMWSCECGYEEPVS